MVKFILLIFKYIFLSKKKTYSDSYMDNKVFASLKNGELAVFKRIYCKFLCHLSKLSMKNYNIDLIITN